MIVDAPPGKKGQRLCGEIFQAAGRGDIQALFAKCLLEALGPVVPSGLAIGAVVLRRPVVVTKGKAKVRKGKAVKTAVAGTVDAAEGKLLFVLTVARSAQFVAGLQKALLEDLGQTFDGAGLSIVAHADVVACRAIGRCGYRRMEGFAAHHSLEDGTSECQFNALAEDGQHEMRCEVVATPPAAGGALIEPLLRGVLVSPDGAGATLAKDGRTVEVGLVVDKLSRGKKHDVDVRLSYVWGLNGDPEEALDRWLGLPPVEAAQFKDLLRPLVQLLPARLKAPACDATWRFGYLR